MAYYLILTSCYTYDTSISTNVVKDWLRLMETY